MRPLVDALRNNLALSAEVARYKEALEFVWDACARLNNARAVALNNREMLAEELTDIENVIGEVR